jgi:hypothetical protein
MTDLATFGFAVDTSGLVQGGKALDDFAAKGGTTARAVGNASGTLSRELRGLSAAVNALVAPANAMAQAMQRAGQSTAGIAPPISAAEKAAKAAAQEMLRLQSSMNSLATAGTTPLQAAMDRLTAAEKDYAAAVRAGVPMTERHGAGMQALRAEVDRLRAGKEKLTQSTEANSRATAGGAGAIGRMVNSVKTMSAGFMAASFAGTALGAGLAKLISSSIAAAEQFERLGLRTEAIVKATGGAAGVSAEQIRGLSQDIARSTLASTAGVEVAAQKLLTFRSVAGETFERTLRAAQDLAAVGFGSIDGAAVQLGKALENPIEGMGALTRVGVSFSAQQKEVIQRLVETGNAAEAQRVMLAGVERQVAGAGTAEARGLAGAYDTLKQNLEEFLTTIGNRGPIQLATLAIKALAGAIESLHGLVTPRTATVAADAAVEAAQKAYDAAVRSQNRRGLLGGALSMFEGQRDIDKAAEVLRQAKAAREQITVDAYAREAAIAASSALALKEIERENQAGRLKSLKESFLTPREKLLAQHAANMKEIQNSFDLGLIRDPGKTALQAKQNEILQKSLAALDAQGAKVGRSLDVEAQKRQEVINKLKDQVQAAQAAHAGNMEGVGISREMATALEVEAQLRAAGIPPVEERTAAEREAADAIAAYVVQLSKMKEAEEDAAQARAKALAEVNRFNREVESQSRAIANDVSRNIFDRLMDPSKATSVVDFFKSIFRRIAAQALSANIVLPITTAIVGGIPGMFGIAAPGEAGGGSIMSGLGQMLGLSGLLPTGGLSGMLAGANASLFGTAGIAPMAGASFAEGAGATAGLLGSGGAASLGGILGAGGLGFGAGMLLNGMMGGNQTSGMIGSAAGTGLGIAAALALDLALPGVGTLLGLLGGAAGGGLGGLIGPKPSVEGWGLRLQSGGFNEATGQNGFADSLLPVSRQYFNESGAQTFQQADALVEAVNRYLNERSLQVGGVSIVGGNKNGADYSWADAGSLSEAFTRLRFRSTDNDALTASLEGKTFDDPAKLQEWVDGFLAAQAAIDKLGTEPLPAFAAQIQAINDVFDAAVETAKKYGLAEEKLNAERQRQIEALEAQRTEVMRRTNVSMSIRMMVAQGGGLDAELAQQAEDARLEMEAFTEQLTSFAVAAAEAADMIADLEEVQGAERVAIIRRYAEQANEALRQAGGSIRNYLDSLASGTAAGASPSDRLTASQAAFERDLSLASGAGGAEMQRDALSRITSSADALLSAGQDVYASGAGFQGIKQSIIDGLTNLPVVQSYDALMTASLEAIQAALADGTAEVGINAGANEVTIAGASTAALETIGRSQINLLSAIRTEAFTIAEVAHTIAAGTRESLYEIGVVAHTIAAGTTVAVSHVHAAIATGNQFLAVIAAIGQASNDHLAVGNLVAADAIVASVAGFAALTQVAADGAAAVLAGVSVGNQVSADGAVALLDALNAGNTIAVDASAAAVEGLGAITRAVVDAAGILLAAQSAGNTITADMSTVLTLALNASNTIAASNAGFIVSALNAGNTIAATGADFIVAAINAGNGVLASYTGTAPATDAALLGALQHLGQLGEAINGAAGDARGLLAVANNWLNTLANHATSQHQHTMATTQAVIGGAGQVVEAQGAGNIIAASAIEANLTGQAVGHQIAVDASLANVQAQNAGNAIAAAIGGMMIDALSAGNVITADILPGMLVGFGAANQIAVDASLAAVTALNSGNSLAVFLGNAQNNYLRAANDFASAGNNWLKAIAEKDGNASLLGPIMNLVQLGQAINGAAGDTRGLVAVGNNWLATLVNHAVNLIQLGEAVSGNTAGIAPALAVANNWLATLVNHAVEANGLLTIGNQTASATLDATIAGLGVVAQVIADSAIGLMQAAAAGHEIAVSAAQATVEAAAAGHQIAADASAANVHTQAVGHQIAVDVSAAAVQAASAGHQIAVSSATGIIEALAAGLQIAVDASAANITAHSVSHQIATDVSMSAMLAHGAGHQIAVDASAANVDALNLGNHIAVEKGDAIRDAITLGNQLAASASMASAGYVLFQTAVIVDGFDRMVAQMEAVSEHLMLANRYAAATAWNTKYMLGDAGITISEPPAVQPAGSTGPDGAQEAAMDVAPLVYATARLETAVRDTGAVQTEEIREGLASLATAVDSLRRLLDKVTAR